MERNIYIYIERERERERDTCRDTCRDTDRGRLYPIGVVPTIPAVDSIGGASSGQYVEIRIKV